MTYYLLPKNNILLSDYIKCIISDTTPTPVISHSLSHYLCDIKNKLYETPNKWDTYKKYTNPYEFIHSNIPQKNKCICNYKPLSRSYFKMIEIIHTFDLLKDINNLNSFHLAEGPGGFIEAIANLRKCPTDKYIGMTLINNNDNNIPGWRKSNKFLKTNKNVYIESGIDGTGNILSLANFDNCKRLYESSMDIITADGGFDFSIDYNNQENNIARLLFAQICYALILQKKGGCFVLKMFDSFMQHTIDALSILSSFYEYVYIMKPNTSRYANSEKYIICKNFLYYSNVTYYTTLYNAFKEMVESPSNTYICRFLNCPIANYYISRIEEYNAIFGQQQIENINYTLNLIDQECKQNNLDKLIKTNIIKSIQWCIKYNIPYNTIND